METWPDSSSDSSSCSLSSSLEDFSKSTFLTGGVTIGLTGVTGGLFSGSPFPNKRTTKNNH